jgi:SAM-dependent methyltransferase
MINSWTEHARPVVEPYLKGYGVDLGYGGEAILHNSINIDLPKPYTNVGNDPQHYGCDCRELPFKDETLDYVYSSHLLEDSEDIATVLTEWLRVLKPNGILALCLPYERKYREYCRKRGEGRNKHHSHEDMRPELVTDAAQLSIELIQDLEPYSFVIVARKLLNMSKKTHSAHSQWPEGCTIAECMRVYATEDEAKNQCETWEREGYQGYLPIKTWWLPRTGKRAKQR